VRSLFKEEIQKDRAEIRDLNQLAQDQIIARRRDFDPSRVDSTGSTSGIIHHAVPLLPGLDNVDSRLMKIESLMKQKATKRHYLMLAFYILSLVALKLDEPLSLLDYIFDKKSFFSRENITGQVKSSKLGRKIASQDMPADTKKKTANSSRKKIIKEEQP
jgi:hypothetical protein